MRHITTTLQAYKDHPLLVSDDIIVTGLRGTHFRGCHIGIVPEGDEGRKVYQGPMVPGPWGFAVTHASVIDNTGLAASRDAAAIRFEVGERFTVGGLPGMYYFRSPDRRRLEGDGPKLECDTSHTSEA